MRIKIIILIIVLFLGAYYTWPEKKLGGSPTAEATLKGSLDSLESSYTSPIAGYKKYQSLAETLDSKSGYKYKIEEYVVWNGNDIPKGTGYQLYIMKPDGSVMSTGTGPLADKLSFSWFMPSYGTSTPSLNNY